MTSNFCYLSSSARKLSAVKLFLHVMHPWFSFCGSRIYYAFPRKKKKKKVRTLAGHSNRVYSAAFSPDGLYVVTGSNPPKIWDAETGEEVLSVSCVSWLCSNQSIACACVTFLRPVCFMVFVCGMFRALFCIPIFPLWQCRHFWLLDFIRFLCETFLFALTAL